MSLNERVTINELLTVGRNSKILLSYSMTVATLTGFATVNEARSGRNLDSAVLFLTGVGCLFTTAAAPFMERLNDLRFDKARSAASAERPRSLGEVVDLRSHQR